MKKIKIKTSTKVPNTKIDILVTYTNSKANTGDNNWVEIRKEGGSSLTQELVHKPIDFALGDVFITQSGFNKRISDWKVELIAHCCVLDAPIENTLVHFKESLKNLFKDIQYYKTLRIRTIVILWPPITCSSLSDKNNNIIANTLIDELIVYQQSYPDFNLRNVILVADESQTILLNKYLKYRTHWLLKYFKFLWK